MGKSLKAYFQGRIQTRSYTGKDGTQKSTTEIIAEDMLMLSGAPIGKKAAALAHTKEEPEGTDTSAQTELDFDPNEIPF